MELIFLIMILLQTCVLKVTFSEGYKSMNKIKTIASMSDFPFSESVLHILDKPPKI